MEIPWGGHGGFSHNKKAAEVILPRLLVMFGA
jgi:hypothetical protein